MTLREGVGNFREMFRVPLFREQCRRWMDQHVRSRQNAGLPQTGLDAAGSAVSQVELASCVG